jgi:hypothetical protein
MMTEEPDEDQILTVCALRFDGWAYADQTGLSFPEATRRIEDGQWPESREERLAIFFAYQRFLSKWGGEQLAKNGKIWRIFRTLFLDLHDAEIPEPFRSSDFLEQWGKIDHPRAVALVRQIHESTEYDDNAPPTPSALTVPTAQLPKRQRRK